MWNTFEGLEHGLEDVERVVVYGSPEFNMEKFLTLRSARWLTIGPGQTLFLPGDFTHRVVTLERYLGVGSFYVSLPNCLRTVSRWLLQGPLWSKTYGEETGRLLVEQIAHAAVGRISRLRRASECSKNRWGFYQLP